MNIMGKEPITSNYEKSGQMIKQKWTEGPPNAEH